MEKLARPHRGGVSRRPTRNAREERSSRAPVAAVEGIRSSESRRPSRGGGGTMTSVGQTTVRRPPPSYRLTHRRQWMSRDSRAGERRQRAEAKPHAPSAITKSATETRPCPRSTDPFYVTTRHQASRSGKPEQSGGTGTGVGWNGRRAARRSSSLPQGRGMAGQKRKTVSAVVPARKESRGRSARTSQAVAEVDKRRRISNKPIVRAPKRVAAVGERGSQLREILGAKGRM